MHAWLFQRGLSHGRVMSPITQVNSRFNQVCGSLITAAAGDDVVRSATICEDSLFIVLNVVQRATISGQERGKAVIRLKMLYVLQQFEAIGELEGKNVVQSTTLRSS